MILRSVIMMVDRTTKPTKKKIDLGTEIRKGEFTLKVCEPFIARKKICLPDIDEIRPCEPLFEKICIPSVIFGDMPGHCGIVCEVQCMIVDIGKVVREEMLKYAEKNMAQYTSLKKEIDVKTDAILKEVRARK